MPNSRYTFNSTTTGLFVYVYQHGQYTDPNKRVLCTEGSNKVYWFNRDDANLAGITLFDIGTYVSDPGTGDHTTVYNAQKLSEKENRVFTSEENESDLATHIADVANPHEVSLTQVCTKEAVASVTVANLTTLTNGSDASTLHTHSEAIADEVIGTGTGALKTFAVALTYKPMIAGSLSITDTVEIFTDNGDGTLTGDAGGTGTINYTTGVGSVTFKSNVGLGQDIEADYNSAQYSPTAHKTSHETGGADPFGTEDLDATMSAITDTGGYFTGTDAETVLQEIGAGVFKENTIPTGLAVTKNTVPGLLSVLNILWDGSTDILYDIYILNKNSMAQDMITFIGCWKDVGWLKYIVYGDAKYGIKVRSRSVLGLSDWSSEVEITVDDIGTPVDLQNLKQLVDLLTGEKIAEGFMFYPYENAISEHTIGCNGTWKQFIDVQIMDKSSYTNKIRLQALKFYTSDATKEVSLRATITYPDGTTEVSSSVSTTKIVSDSGLAIDASFSITSSQTGICQVLIEAYGASGATLATVGFGLKQTN
jgi:hypothetical protein